MDSVPQVFAKKGSARLFNMLHGLGVVVLRAKITSLGFFGDLWDKRITAQKTLLLTE